jgi:uncharacterized protein YdeI (YjbR/CyaY-like superfamily)
MGKRDPRVDAYIAKSPDFAKPILSHIRKIMHSAVPEVEEAWKWSAPAFEYKGLLAIMATFKSYAALNLWKAKLILDERDKDSAGNFGKLATIKDLPPDKILAGYFRKAAELNETGVKVKKAPASAKKALPIPPELKKALAKNAKAKATFDGFSPSHRREYIQWISEAKSEETRERRVTTAIEWMAEGKPRMWKYMRR